MTLSHERRDAANIELPQFPELGWHVFIIISVGLADLEIETLAVV